MPVDCNLSKEEVIYQREQYRKGGIGRLYCDYCDKIILDNINKNTKSILDAGCGEGITSGKLCSMYPDKDVRRI